MFAWVFDSLQVDGSKLPQGVVGDVARTVASWWNFAVDLLRRATKAVVEKVTAPLLGVLHEALGTYALVTHVVGYLQPWQLTVASSDKLQFPLRIVGEAPVTGTLIAAAERTAPGWPDALVDCARTLGVTLPAPTAVGSTVEFALTPSRPDLLRFARPLPLREALGDDFTARVPFETGQEDRETAVTAASTSAPSRSPHRWNARTSRTSRRSCSRSWAAGSSMPPSARSAAGSVRWSGGRCRACCRRSSPSSWPTSGSGSRPSPGSMARA